MSARRSCSMRSLTRRAGSGSMTSTNCQGMARALNLRETDSRRGSRQNAFKDPAKRAAQPDFDFSHAQVMGRSLAGPLQIYVVNADHFSAVDVDNLTVDEVPLQKQIAAFVLEGRNRLGGAQFQACRQEFPGLPEKAQWRGRCAS